LSPNIEHHPQGTNEEEEEASSLDAATSAAINEEQHPSMATYLEGMAKLDEQCKVNWHRNIKQQYYQLQQKQQHSLPP
jgi:hypothetical protein